MWKAPYKGMEVRFFTPLPNTPSMTNTRIPQSLQSLAPWLLWEASPDPGSEVGPALPTLGLCLSSLSIPIAQHGPSYLTS